MSETCTDKSTRKEHEERRNKFQIALYGTVDDNLEKEGTSPEFMADDLPPPPNREVTDVVFVVHGIRDKGFWTQKIAGTIKKHLASLPKGHKNKKTTDGKDRKIVSWAESYGYFAMLPFVLQPVRQRKVGWLMYRYVEARARYPNAAFHYVGHSNGTYLVARALHDYPASRFKRIVFAGSVVRRDYDWSRFTKQNPPRVEKVLNFVATRDWVVALVPKALQTFKSRLGSAGHDGFDEDRPDRVGQDPVTVHQVRYIVGSHGAGLEELVWKHIAKFIVSGDEELTEDSQINVSDTQNKFVVGLGAVSFVLFPLVVVIGLLFGVGLLWSTFAPLPCEFVPFWREPTLRICTVDPTAREAAWRAVGFFAYLLLVFLVVTRV